MVHYTFQHMSTITKLSPEVIQYYMNITSLICAIAGIQGNEQVLDGLLEIHATATPL